MDPVQIAAMATLFSVPKRPRIVDVAYSSGGAALTLEMGLPHRREAGLLLLAITTTDDADSTNTISGWTSIANITGNDPAPRVYYRFSTGTEAPTVTVNAGAGTVMTSIVLAIAGCISSRPPTASLFAYLAATDADPPNLAATAPYGAPLWLALATANAGNIIGNPIGFSSRYEYNISATGITTRLVAENLNVGTLNPSIFKVSASADGVGGTICVRSA